LEDRVCSRRVGPVYGQRVLRCTEVDVCWQSWSVGARHSGDAWF
jgi:hypothetical protein